MQPLLTSPALMKKRVQELTDLQHDVMRALWARGEASAAEVTDALRPRRKLATTTVATMLTRLEKKGVVAHRVDGRVFIYRAKVAEGDVRRTLLTRLKQAFEGDVTALLAQLIRDEELGAEDLARARELIEVRERELKGEAK